MCPFSVIKHVTNLATTKIIYHEIIETLSTANINQREIWPNLQLRKLVYAKNNLATIYLVKVNVL